MTSISRCQYVIRIRLVLQTFVHSENSKGFASPVSFSEIRLHFIFFCNPKCSQINGQSGKTDPITSAFFKVLFPTQHERGGTTKIQLENDYMVAKNNNQFLSLKTKATKKPGKGCYGPFRNTMPQISWIQDNVSRPSKKNFKTIYGA